MLYGRATSGSRRQSQISNLVQINQFKETNSQCGLSLQALSSKEVKQNQEEKQKMTEHFIQVLPLLLEKYKADAEKLTNLLAVPQFFDLEIYTTSRLESVSNLPCVTSCRLIIISLMV